MNTTSFIILINQKKKKTRLHGLEKNPLTHSYLCYVEANTCQTSINLKTSLRNNMREFFSDKTEGDVSCRVPLSNFEDYNIIIFRSI